MAKISFSWPEPDGESQCFSCTILQFPELSLGDSPFCILSTSAYLSDFTPQLLLKSGKIQGSQSLCFFGIKEEWRVHYLLRSRRVWSPVGGWSRWCQHMTLHNIESVPQGKSSSFLFFPWSLWLHWGLSLVLVHFRPFSGCANLSLCRRERSS